MACGQQRDAGDGREAGGRDHGDAETAAAQGAPAAGAFTRSSFTVAEGFTEIAQFKGKPLLAGTAVCDD
jgi:hypothetical protein